MRQVVLDTETTGLEVAQDHRIIEIGCVELINRRITGRRFHRYVNPERDIDEGALAVHGISNDDLADKPLFAQVVADFLNFVDDAELVIHNAPFDLGFINSELKKLAVTYPLLEERCSVIDTLLMARQLHPGQKNNLNALCKRYGVNNSQRELHGALLDAEILADVYLAMTGGQGSLTLGDEPAAGQMAEQGGVRPLPTGGPRPRVLLATELERQAHQSRLAALDRASAGNCRWPRGD